MGFGFNLFFVFILVPLTVILLIVWAITKKNIFGKALGIIWVGIIGLSIVSGIKQRQAAKVLLKKKDFYGEYIVDRAHYSGSQSDWQYNHFRFDIRENDSIFFYVTDNKNILTTYSGKITTTKPYSSERLIINMRQPTHHVLKDNPTTYRNNKSFYLVFYSHRFGNVFFKKGQWTTIVLRVKASDKQMILRLLLPTEPLVSFPIQIVLEINFQVFKV